jgi:hypothetical protein
LNAISNAQWHKRLAFCGPIEGPVATSNAAINVLVMVLSDLRQTSALSFLPPETAGPLSTNLGRLGRSCEGLLRVDG